MATRLSVPEKAFRLRALEGMTVFDLVGAALSAIFFVVDINASHRKRGSAL